VQQIAVRHVQFERVDARALGTFRTVGKRISYPHKTVPVERGGRSLMRRMGNRGRRDRLPRAFLRRQQMTAFPGNVRRALAPGMRELHRDR